MSDAAAVVDHHRRVRAAVLRLREGEPSLDTLTATERQAIDLLQPLWEADAQTIARLRRYGQGVGGAKAADYDAQAADLKARLDRDLRRLLLRGYRALWVDEPAALGGFGFHGKAQLYNEDTLRFFRVVSLLDDAALIHEYRSQGPRHTVWEIGGGWGGFACYFKTLCANVTYLITGRPEFFLLSAVYLMTLFPAARVRFYDRAAPDTFWADWDQIDFAFAPESAVAAMRPPSLDLAVDLGALARMSAERASLHVQRAYDLGCRYLFTERMPGPSVEHLYWRHPVSAPAYVRKRLSLGASAPGAVEPDFFLGWRRLRP